MGYSFKEFADYAEVVKRVGQAKCRVRDEGERAPEPPGEYGRQEQQPV